MIKEFITTSIFDKQWNELNLTDDDLHKLQNLIMQNPYIGDIIQGTGGAIKMRFALPGQGRVEAYELFMLISHMLTKCIYYFVTQNQNKQAYLIKKSLQLKLL